MPCLIIHPTKLVGTIIRTQPNRKPMADPQSTDQCPTSPNSIIRTNERDDKKRVGEVDGERLPHMSYLNDGS